MLIRFWGDSASALACSNPLDETDVPEGFGSHILPVYEVSLCVIEVEDNLHNASSGLGIVHGGDRSDRLWSLLLRAIDPSALKWALHRLLIGNS